MSAVFEDGEDRAPQRTRIRLWDLPLRIFHWSLALAVTVAVVTGKLGGPWMDLHGKAGLAIVGLVAFRLAWGLIGSTHARFLHFAPTPAKLSAYLQGRWRGVGHNPLGAFAVFALLGLLAVQAGTGLFSNDDIAFSGPLFNSIDDDLAGRITGLHRQLANVLLALVAIHVAAIAFYFRFKKDNLVKPMVTGWKEVEAGEPAERGGPVAFGVAMVIALGVLLAIDAAAHGLPSLHRQAAAPGADSPTAAPAFTLVQLHDPSKHFGPQDMKGQVWLLNVWASWCTACRQEHPLLLDLARSGVAPIVGLDYMDAPQEGARWLARHGDPYHVSVLDSDGQVGTQYGVHGVPQTYVIDQRGAIRLKLAGPLTPERINTQLLPLIKALRGT